jgi:hypothetical protein
MPKKRISRTKDNEIPLRRARKYPLTQIASEKPGPAHSDLQHYLGNRALQRTIVQRQGGPARPNLYDPAAMMESIIAEAARNKAAVRNWLAPNTPRLRLLTIDQLVSVVRRNVVEAGRLSDIEVQEAVRQLAGEQQVVIPTLPLQGTPTFASTLKVQIPDAVKKAFSIAIDGIDVVKTDTGRVNISVKGATAQLGRVKTTVSWGGSLGIDVPVSGFQLAGKLDKDHWEISLSSPGESSLPDLSKLAETFRKGEAAMRGILSATASLSDLNSVSEISAAITPHVSPAKDAVQALVDIAKSQPGVSYGVTIGGSTEGGITVSATLTIRF